MQSPSKKKPSFKDVYEIIDKIGAGRMGVIYKVKKKGDLSGEVYASKHISLSDIDLQVAKKQLRILESLKHMYIVHYYEQFFSQSELIIITQFCEGKDLTYHINQMRQKRKYFNENLVSTWIFQLIMAIDYIHSMNIIHRDLKPQNIFVDQDMNLKIGDFGVSKILDGTEHCKTMAGSPLYLSPQLLHEENYTKKTDIWSLGCVIFQICSLQVPFKSKKGLYELCDIIKTKQPKNIPTIYSSDLNKLIKLMLIKDPKKRPSAQQLYQHPILVNLLINYSSNVNLKEEYSSKALQKPSLTDSFVDEQSKAINQRLKKFEDQIKKKMESFKNKKVGKNQIERNYEEVQKKMKELEKIMHAAFQEIRNKGEDIPDTGQTFNKTIRNNSSSGLSESDETIQSVNLGQTQNPNNNLGESSIDSVNSIMIQSKKQSSLWDSKQSARSNRNQGDDGLDATLQSQYAETIKDLSNASQVKKVTLSRLSQISKEIAENPNLILDETFLSCTLSLSNNDPYMFSARNNPMKKKKPSHDITQSQESLNFDFSKKSYDQSLKGLKLQKKEQQGHKKSDKSVEDSLDQYQADFESFEEDQLDLRAQEKETVKRLFATTLKNMSIRNDSNASNASYQNPGIKSKYALSLSEIKQISSCAEQSTISRNSSEFD